MLNHKDISFVCGNSWFQRRLWASLNLFFFLLEQKLMTCLLASLSHSITGPAPVVYLLLHCCHELGIGAVGEPPTNKPSRPPIFLQVLFIHDYTSKSIFIVSPPPAIISQSTCLSHRCSTAAVNTAQPFDLSA